MPDGTREYSHHVFNDSGFILNYPAIGDEVELLQSSPPNPLAESSTQQFPLATKLTQGERVWRYCKNSSSALTVVGSAISSAITVHADATEDAVVAASTGQTYAIGSYDITIVSTSNIAAAPWSTANGGKDGYIYVNGGTGIGMCRKIKSHEAFSSTDGTLVTVYEPWNVAPIAADTECGLSENPYSNVVVCAALSDYPIGVNPLAITASYYFWAQSGGPAAVASNEAIPVGTMAIVGTTAGKADANSAFTTEIILGYPITPGIKNTDHFLIFLTLDR